MADQVPEIYTQDHRHFDNLIWQVPAWSTALFGLASTATVIGLANAAAIGRTVPAIDVHRTLGLFLVIVAMMLVALTLAFIKFRMHQTAVFRPNRLELPQRWYFPSGQACLLFVLQLEAVALFGFAAVLANWITVNAFGVVSGTCLFIVFAATEVAFRRVRVEIKRKYHPAPSAA